MNVKEFYEQLESHNWHYCLSDDFDEYDKGLANQTRLFSLTQSNPILRKLFKEFQRHHFSGSVFGITRYPKPILKNFVVEISSIEDKLNKTWKPS
jgi:hypothetical protein